MRAVATAVAVITSVLVASGCASSGPNHTAHYTTSPPTTSAGLPPVSPHVHAIEVARSSNRIFSIFPAVPGKRRCAIPVGALARKPFRGICQTSVHRAQTHEPAVIISFTERWGQAASCPANGYCMVPFKWHHTWQVIEGKPIVTAGAKLHVLATRSSGATAPQDYK